VLYDREAGAAMRKGSEEAVAILPPRCRGISESGWSSWR
jgi:hypothetical protein